MCKDCYGKGVIYQTNGFTGITTFTPCHCNKPKPHKQWLSDLIKKMAEKDGKTEDEIREYLGVTT
ncbi:hypothetical protein [Vagococcus fluvialis]|uniref:hypothetical protein n=1 Tax=Vagococcus fluvialis TaxID=2738 RepID=UPI001D09A215|nr:hypothetical protein [Vagococcus fluvialis]UDM70159.1 hypothetical protein K5L00_08395 [Vagococcus fluvialis]UDM77578.1 hypothetical protein K5K98_03940 [Vagococcus fluvialis]UDM81848.1 hypothetical protein K5K96_10875 [Vagococcus fluvialis]